MSSPIFTGAGYSEEQVNRWLRHLARGMQERGQTIFLIEQLQPGWLQRRWQRWAYIMGSRMFEVCFFVLIFFVASLLSGFTFLRGQIQINWTSSLQGSALALLLVLLMWGIPLGLMVGLIDVAWFRRIEVNPLQSRWIAAQFFLYWTVASLTLFVPGQIVRHSHSFKHIVGSVLLALVWVTPFFYLRFRTQAWARDIQTVEALHWSWRRFLTMGLRWSLFLGLLAGPFFSFIAYKDLRRSLGVALAVGGCGTFLVGLLLWPIVGFFVALRPDVVELANVPNQGMRLSLRNALLAGASSFLGVGSSYGLLLVSALVIDRQIRFLGEGQVVLVVGLAVGGALFRYGSIDILRHYILRLLLAQRGYLPYSLPRFLEYASRELHLLQRAGAGYMFIHRFLFEYFASLAEPGPLSPRTESGRDAIQNI